MRLPTDIFAALTGPSAYKVRRLLCASEFANFCRDRGELVNEDRLRKLEQLGLFKPLLRVRRPDDTRKIEIVDPNSYRDLGLLEDGETWTGETRVELLQFGFRPSIVDSWREHGLIWSPFDGPSTWEAEIDTDRVRHEAYYSEFQIWDLMWVLSALTLRVSADNAVDGSGAPNGNHDNLSELTLEMMTDALAHRTTPRFREAYGLFMQLISDRFFFHTQTDARLITVSQDGTWWGWEWPDYVRAWTPDPVVAALQIEARDSASIESQLSAEQRMANPLDAWRGLTRFVALDQRKKLKGKALLAETLAEMAEMHRRFHQAAFGQTLPDPNEIGFPRGGTPPVSAADDPYQALEWVTNQFHLNPKPKLVLIVEGQTEEAVIPEIFERWFGAPAARYGIQIRNLHGVGNATGSKRDGMSALWRLIDFLHAQQTIALVLLDREGLAGRNIERGLRLAPSIHFTDRRVTRREYVKLWGRCFELDNFSNSEIAAAMSGLSGVTIKGPELADCRPSAASGAKPVPLDVAYRSLTGQALKKVALSRKLIEAMFDPATRRKPGSRPIVRYLEFAAGRSVRNHQPTTAEIWEENQRSGYLGALQPGAASRRKRRRPKTAKTT